MIQTIGLNKSYGKHQVLLDIHLELEDNKIYGLLGRNGVGKTTLLNILSNHIRASSGQVLLDGEPIYENPKAVEQVAMVREWGVGRDMRIDKLLQTAAIMYQNWDKAYAKRLIERFKLDPKLSYSSLSRGEQTMVGFILGLASRCRYTFFDEPSLGLDAANREDFYQEILADYAEYPRCIVISTHLIDEGANLFEDVIILKDKAVLVNQSVASLLSNSYLLSGRPEELAPFIEGREILDSTSFGSREMVTLQGELTPEEDRRRSELGIERSDVSLQKLFVLLTK